MAVKRVKAKRRPDQPMLPVPRVRASTKAQNAPRTAKWKVICARTRAAKAERDAMIAGVKR